MIADPLWSCVMLLCGPVGPLWSFAVLCGPLRYLVIPQMMYVVCLVGFSPGVLEFWLTIGG